MRVLQFTLDLLPDLTILVNDQIRAVPPGWTLSELQVAMTLSQVDSLWAVHYPDDERPSRVQTTCVLEGERLVAAAQWGLPAFDDPALPPYTTLFWAVALPDYDEHLKALLDTIAVRSRSLSCSHIHTSRFAFGVGWSGIPTIWTHMIEGFQEAGFEVVEKWVLMTGDATAEFASLSPAWERLRFEWQVDEEAREWRVHAYIGQEFVGECEAWGIPLHFDGCPGFEEWIALEWVGVKEGYRQQGIGLGLLQEQLRYQSWRGIKKAIAWVQGDNVVARRLNQALGFQDGPECWVVEKPLK